MEKYFEGGSLDYRVFTTSTDLKDELITSLTSFIQLYSQHKDRLQRSSDSFVLTAARLHEMHEEVTESKETRVLLAVIGGVLGGAFGGVAGGVLGAIGGVSAVTCASLFDDIDLVGATVSFVGSVFGGVVGGVFGGTIGGAVDVGATGSPVYAVVNNVAWFTISFAIGGAIGHTFGGTVGAAGGAVGGAFGALFGTRFAVSLVGGVAGHFCGGKDSEEQKTKSENLDMIQKAVDFMETIKPLVEELKKIKTIGDKMASSAFVHSVAGQAAKTLASVTTMEKTLSDSQEATDLPQFVLLLLQHWKQSKKITEELEKTRAEVEKLLVSEAGC